MPTQTTKQRQSSNRPEEQVAGPAVSERDPKAQDLLDYSDELLDDIEDALQGLDWDLATTYEQKGGE